MSTREDWSQSLMALVEKGQGEAFGQSRFFPLHTLDSGARVGLDQTGTFALWRDQDPPLVTYSPEQAYVFHEVVESKRNHFDDAIEEGANNLGLPGLDVSIAFPTLTIVRAVLAKNMHYTTRLALTFLRPTELRDMRDEIKKIAEDRFTPTALRDLAERLLVPS